MGEFKKVVRLFHANDFAENLRPLTVDLIFFSDELLLANAIKSFVFLEIDLSFIVKGLESLLDKFFVDWIGGTNKFCLRDLQFLAQIDEASSHLIDILLRLLIIFLCGLLNLLTMFIGTGEKKDLFAKASLITGDHISETLFVGMSEMGAAIGVIDRGGEKEGIVHKFRGFIH